MNMNPYPNPISEEPKPPKTKSKVGKGCLIAGLVGAGGAVLLFIVALIFVFSFSGTVYIPDNGVLVLKVAGNHPDYKPRDPVADFFEIPQPTSFSDLVKQLRKAKVDKRIRGVLIELQDNDLGWARANELRESIKDFRISGKPVYAYMESGGNKEYFIATAADKIAIPSAGDLFINGLAAGVTFYRGSLDKLGVDAEVIQIGKYKNAPDQFTRKSMSDQQREVVDALLDKHFDTLIATIAATRGIDRETVKSLIDNAPYRASDAKENGLIDIIGSKDFVHEEMKRALRIGTDEMFESVSMTDYATVTEEALGLGTGEKIAIVYASGAIDVGTSREDPLMGTTMGSETISDSIKEAADDSEIKAIVLRVDSPGGSALASNLIWEAVEYAKSKRKPVVVSMADVAASGGYYIAANADRIIADPDTITGSIGVFLGKPVLKGFYDWLGISNEYVLRGKNAGIFRETETWTPSERAKMQELANKTYYEDFLPKVASGRSIDLDVADGLGQGRVWTGEQAKERGLIDEFGGLEKAIAVAKKLAKIPTENDVARVEYPQTGSFFEQLLGGGPLGILQSSRIKETNQVVESMPADMRKAFISMRYLERMRNGESMLILPFIIEVK